MRRFMFTRCSLVLFVAVCAAQNVAAQSPFDLKATAFPIVEPTNGPLLPAVSAEDVTFGSEQTTTSPKPGDNRACDGCPRRRVGTSLLQVTYVNGIYELANLIRGQDTAKITPKTWWHNMKRGWEWDLDEFVVNQIGHPYQGNNYFTTGRANGLSYWESAGVTAFCSA